MTSRGKKAIKGATYGWLALALVAVVASAAIAGADLLTHTPGVHLGDVVKGWDTGVLVPAYWLFVLVIVLAERKWPAEKRAGALSSGGAVDLIWLLIAPIFSLTIVSLYLIGLQWLYVNVLQSFSLDMPSLIGAIPAAILAFLAADFGMWFTHFIRHKVPLFWQFHMVHHSQEKMSVLTDNRVHFVEAMVSATIVYLPLRLVGLSNEASVVLAFATVFITGFTHANLRTNVGPLRWIMVTPQSHRVHHSDQPEHYDHNFGAVLSIWDRIFRTDWKGVDVYPSTGIADPAFPIETNAPWHAAPQIYVQQVAQPFHRVWTMVRT